MISDRRLLPPEVARALGPFYVYVLTDPRTNQVFYVGKGTRDRLVSHINEGVDGELRTIRGQSAKRARVREIRASGAEPVLEVVRRGLSSNEAFLVESALIDCVPGLTNAVGG